MKHENGTELWNTENPSGTPAIYAVNCQLYLSEIIEPKNSGINTSIFIELGSQITRNP